MTEPLISLVIPFYAGQNQAPERVAFLDDCLGSVKTQTFRDWEAVVVDDGSANEASVREAIARQNDDRFRYARHEVNRGLGAARNTGFRTSRADILLPLDSDDRLHPGFLEETFALLTRPHAIDCAFTHFRTFGDREGVTRLEVRPWPEILRTQWIPGPGTLMRRRVWEVAGGYAEIPDILGNEDWDFWIAALSRGITAVVLPAPLYEYRVWAGSLTFRYPPQDGHAARRIIYSRQRQLFRAHRLNRDFLAGGYLNSSTAARQVGRRAAAFGLAMRGLLLSPLNARLWKGLAGALVPTDAERHLRAAIGKRRQTR